MARLDEFTEKVQNSSEEDIKKTLKGKRFYRNSRVRMYYSNTYTESATPTPFCEVRVWSISEQKDKEAQKKLREALDRIEDFYLDSISDYAKRWGVVVHEDLTEEHELDENFARYPEDMKGVYIPAKIDQTVINNVFIDDIEDVSQYKIQGREENVVIDGQEALISFLRTGLPKDRWNLDEVFRYVCFFDQTGYPAYEYVESDANLQKYQMPPSIGDRRRYEIFPAPFKAWKKRKQRLEDKQQRRKIASSVFEERTEERFTDKHTTAFYTDRWGNPRIGIYKKGHSGQITSWKPSAFETYEKILEKKKKKLEDEEDDDLFMDSKI